MSRNYVPSREEIRAAMRVGYGIPQTKMADHDGRPPSSE
jgi:hypothetical protein